MAMLHDPPAGINDFDQGQDPAALRQSWSDWLSSAMTPDPNLPAWYDSLNPPSANPPAEAIPEWQGLPNTAILLNQNDVLKAANAVDAPIAFGAKDDPLLAPQPSFLDTAGKPFPGPMYRPQDEYLEWVTIRDPDGVVREISFTCEGPEYWTHVAADKALLAKLYADIIGVPVAQIDQSKLFFQQKVSQKNAFNPSGQPTVYEQGDYNPYNTYNIQYAVHLTQGANTLGAEVGLAMAATLIYGNPPKTDDPDLICCAGYGVVNRFSDPTIGKGVNDQARAGHFVTLRDPVGLYIDRIRDNDFTDWNGQPIPALATGYFTPLRQSADGSLILRARFKVPDGVLRNGTQARVGDLNYQGVPIQFGGQVADAVLVHLFAQALPGAPAQKGLQCQAHPCPDPAHPGFIVPTPVSQPCQPVAGSLASHLAAMRAALPQPPAGPSRVYR